MGTIRTAGVDFGSMMPSHGSHDWRTRTTDVAKSTRVQSSA
jgi:hypothetical protein